MEMDLPSQVSSHLLSVKVVDCYSGPLGAVVIAIFFLALPNRFPDHIEPISIQNHNSNPTISSLKRLDLPGAFLMLSATMLLITALLESYQFGWNSAFTITLLIISGLLHLAFLFWERLVTLADIPTEPVFPWRFIQNRSWMGLLM
jgi:hypothetical protein